MLDHFPLGRGFAWLDTGSPEFMLEASNLEQGKAKTPFMMEAKTFYLGDEMNFKEEKNFIQKVS